MSKTVPHYVPSAMQEARSLLRSEDLDACKRRVAAWVAMNSGKERERHEATLRALESIGAAA